MEKLHDVSTYTESLVDERIAVSPTLVVKIEDTEVKRIAKMLTGCVEGAGGVVTELALTDWCTMQVEEFLGIETEAQLEEQCRIVRFTLDWLIKGGEVVVREPADPTLPEGRLLEKRGAC